MNEEEIEAGESKRRTKFNVNVYNIMFSFLVDFPHRPYEYH